MNEYDGHTNDLAGAYVLDAVSTAEAELVEAHLKVCDSCRREVEELREVVDVLPLALESIEPRADLKARVLAAAREDAQGPDPARPVQDHRADEMQGRKIIPFAPLRRISRLQAVVGAAGLAAILALAIWNVNLQNKVHSQQTNLNALNAVTRAVAAGARVSHFHVQKQAGPDRAVFVQPQNGSQAFVVADGLTPQAGKVYQLWLINSGGPVSAGVFPVAGTGVQVWHVPHPTRGFPTAAVTIEPGPSGSRQPTTAPILITHLTG